MNCKFFLRRLALSSSIAALLCGAEAAAQVSPAQLLPGLPVAEGPAKPGTWVQYSVFHGASGESMSLHVAALEKEGKGQWMEIAIINRARQALVFKFLVEGSLAEPKRVLKTLVQPPGQQPLLLPPKIGQAQLPKVRAGAEPGAKLVGSGPVKVAAGTFQATHYRRAVKGGAIDVWSAAKIPTWPMVKAQTPELVIELAAYGTSARSRVKGKPGKLDEKLLKQLNLAP